MSDHKKLLEMIENVKADDTAALRGVDARFVCFLEQKHFMNVTKGGRVIFNEKHGTPIEYGYNTQKYSTSRDALKAVRPDGWGVGIHCNDKYHTTLMANCYKIGEKGHNIQRSPELPTEELAELHAIIQAIAYERAEND